MTHYAPRTSRRSRRVSHPDSGEENTLIKQRPSVSEVVQMQKTMGNRAVQRTLKDTPVPLAKTISRAPVGAQRTIQRNIFHSAVKGFAKENIFGKNKARRKITEDTDSAKKTNSHIFADIKDVSVKNGSHNLAGRYYKAKQLKKPTEKDVKYAGHTVLFLSGSGGSAETYGLELAKFYCRRGADFVAVNYRGFGGSTKDTKNIFGKDTTTKLDAKDITEEGIYSDAHAIFDWLMNEGVSADKTLIHGFSLGGPVAAELTSYLAGKGIKIAGLILESPMDSVKQQAEESAGKKLGGFAANASGVVMDLRAHLTKLASIDGFKDLAIHFMSGKSANGDQLGLDKTKVDQDAQKMGFTNVTATQAAGADHENVKKHAEIAEKGANTYDNPATSLDRLFQTAKPLITSDTKPVVTDKKDDVVVDMMMTIMSEEIEEETKKEVEETQNLDEMEKEI
jgi:pimeloyl-ACP methyl ester carboxylesterase